MIFSVNINGQRIDYDTDTEIKLYNYLPMLVHSVDIFIQATKIETLDYFLSGDKISLKIDNNDNYIFQIGSEYLGRSFSNPITYWRTPEIQPDVKQNKITIRLPQIAQEEYSEKFSFIGGSDNGPDLNQWPKGINNSFKDDYIGIKIILEAGIQDMLEFNKFASDLIIIVTPSTTKVLDRQYFKYDNPNQAPYMKDIGITY